MQTSGTFPQLNRTDSVTRPKGGMKMGKGDKGKSGKGGKGKGC